MIPGQPQPAMGQPPFGSSPATGPTQNQGYQAAGLAKMGLVVKQLESLLPLVGASSEAGMDVLESIKRLAKHIPPGTVTPAAQNNQMQEMMLNQAKMSGMKPQQPQAGGAMPPQPMPQPAAA